MRFLLLLSLFLSSPLIHAAGNVGDPCCDDWACTSNPAPCNTGLSCCYTRPLWMESIGGICYDPKVSTCATCPVYNPNHPQTQVCPTSSPTCCGDCIDSSKQCCHHYGTYDYFQCQADQICCGFNNGQHTCCNSNQQCINDMCVNPPICPDGTTVCGTSCYQSNDYVCVDPSNSILCPTSAPALCGGACYSEGQYTCTNGVLSPIQIGTNPTDGPTTAPTTAPTTGPTSATAAPGCVMPGDLSCGIRCYSPITHVCANAGIGQLCPIAYPSACGDACYSTTQYSCVNGQLGPVSGTNPTTGPTTAPTTGPTTGPTGPTTGPTAAPGCVMPGDLSCGTRCYSPITHVCADVGTSFLCPVAYPSACGTACYSSTQYTCVNGQLRGV